MIFILIFIEKSFVHKEDLQGDHVNISMNDLLIVEKLLKTLNNLPEEYRSEANKLFEKFNNYDKFLL